LQLLDAINDQSKKRSCELVYRGFLLPNTNVATPSLGAKVIAGQFPSALLNSSELHARDNDRTFTRHTICATGSGTADTGIVVELGRLFHLNHIKLVLLERDQSSYSYYVEVSVDQRDWLRIVDHTHYHCRSRQMLYFGGRAVRFIRVVGTQPQRLSPLFTLVCLEAMYSTEAPQFEIDPESTLLIPRHNVATLPNNAVVVIVSG